MLSRGRKAEEKSGKKKRSIRNQNRKTARRTTLEQSDIASASVLFALDVRLTSCHPVVSAPSASY